MTIETKYNIGDEVWVKTYSGNVYSLLNFADRTESELFPTKEELLKSL